MVIDDTSLKGSQLTRLSSLDGDDTLFFSNQEINFTDNESLKVPFNTLVKRLDSDLTKSGFFGTMITESDSGYAKRDHVHDYSYVTAKAYYSLSDSNELTNLLGTVNISSAGVERKVQLWIPNTQFETFDEKVVGQIRMLNSNKVMTHEEILNSIQNGEFNGWVLADGGTYEKTMGRYDFSEAYESMTNDGNGKFTVPCLSNFFKCNSSIAKNPCQFVEHNSVIPLHSHDLTTDGFPISCDLLTKKVDVTTYLRASTSQASKQPATGTLLAASSNTKETTLDTDSIKASCNFNSQFSFSGQRKLGANPTQSEDREQYPTHVVMIPMVWIGIKEI